MNTASTNILNLLLGIAPAQPGAVNSGLAPTQTGEQPSFDLLFGSLLGANTKGNEAVDTFMAQFDRAGQPPATQSQPLFLTDLKALLEGRTAGQVSMPQINPALLGSFGLDDNDGDADDSGLSNGKTVATDSSLPAFGKSAVATGNPFAQVSPGTESFDTRALMALMPTGPIAPTGADLNSTPVDLPEGDYRILDWSVNNGNINLQLAPADGSADTAIRVSLPLNGLTLSPETAQLIDPNGWQRFDLDGSTDQSKQLLKAFEAVNLKELKIEIANPSATKAATNASQPMQLTLIGENVGQEVAIKANINRNQIRARIGNDAGVLSPKADAIFKPFGPGETRTVVSAQAAIFGSAQDGAADSRVLTTTTGSGFDLFAKSSEGSSKSNATGAPTDQMSALPDFSRSMNQTTLSQNDRAAVPTRFILPENANTVLKPNGQSVQMRLDPEHLGPARLSLSVHNNHLRAAVLVDSVQAKHAVEGSLDRLVQALAKADIKVDFINVTVDQHGSQEQLFDQRPMWARSSRSGRLFNLENDSTAAAAVAPVMYRSGGSYVGTSGVNVLA